MDKITTIFITTPYITLSQLLKFSKTTTTGANAKQYIKNNNVLVNGVSCLERGKKLFCDDVVTTTNQQFLIKNK